MNSNYIAAHCCAAGKHLILQHGAVMTKNDQRKDKPAIRFWLETLIYYDMKNNTGLIEGK